VTNFLRKHKAQLKQSNWPARVHKFKHIATFPVDGRMQASGNIPLSFSRARLAADSALPNLTQTPCYGELFPRNNIE
jgi:hypothetical protein